MQTLRWINHAIAFSMQMIGMEARIGCEGVVDLAASLSDGPLVSSKQHHPGTATSTPEPFDFRSVYPFTLTAAEQQAGFAVLSPTRLPEALSFVGATVDEETNSVRCDGLFIPPTRVIDKL